MPIYEYECEKCRKVKEIFHDINDESPLCEIHNIPMKRLISLTTIRKGAGLYSIDKYEVPKFGDYK